MQDILLYSDATFFDSSLNIRDLGCGAGIIRSLHTQEDSGFRSEKLMIFISARNPVHAEITTGLKIIQLILDGNESSRIFWYCDIPYLEDLVLKKDISASFELMQETLRSLHDLCINGSLKILLPSTSRDTRYHYLCHRACRMGRELISQIHFEDKSISEINQELIRFLEQKKSRWKVADGRI